MLRSVIFDMDGVLIDSEPMYFIVQRALFADLGIVLDPGEDVAFVGWSAESMWAHLKERFPHVTRSAMELSDLTRSRFKEYLHGHPHDAVPIPGVVELLDALKNAGVSCAVASSSGPDTIRMICDTLKITPYFAHLVSGTEVPRSKPAPDVFLRAAQLLGADPAGCVVIEDSANGVRAAQGARMCCVAYRNPGSGEQDLAGADLVVESMGGITVEVLRGLVIRDS